MDKNHAEDISTSGSLIISLLTFGIIYIGYHFSSGWSTRHQAAPSYLAEMCVPVSATDNRMSPPLYNTQRPGSSTNQTDKIRKKKFLCVWSAAVDLTNTECP